MGTRGHLFVVRGHLDVIQHDAALIGLDEDCWVDPRDRFLFPDGPPERPRSWPEGWGRSPGRPVWMVQSGDGSPEEVLTRMRRAVSAVAVAQLPLGGGRTRPLLAMPVLPVPTPRAGTAGAAGTAGTAGSAGSAGTAGTAGAMSPDLAPHAWLLVLLETLRKLSYEHDVDVVLVAQDPGEYAAAQWIRRDWVDLPEHLEPHAVELGVLASRGHLGVFLGTSAGCSAGAVTPGEALAEIAAATDGVDPEDARGLSTAELAELVRLHDEEGGRVLLRSIVARVKRPGLVHALLAASGAHEFVTTAQDTLLERALTEVHDDVPAVLPWSRDTAAPAWVAKTRGDLDHPRDLCLVGPDDTAPSVSLLRGLTLTRHLLVVGSHLDEPELLSALRRPDDEVPAARCGTLLDLEPEGRTASAALWGDRLEQVRVGESADEHGAAELHRTLLLLLDRICVHATRPDRWLLDERFSPLLAPRDQVFAGQVRALLQVLPSDTPTWTPLLRGGEEMGWLGRP